MLQLLPRSLMLQLRKDGKKGPADWLEGLSSSQRGSWTRDAGFLERGKRDSDFEGHRVQSKNSLNRRFCIKCVNSCRYFLLLCNIPVVNKEVEFSLLYQDISCCTILP